MLRRFALILMLLSLPLRLWAGESLMTGSVNAASAVVLATDSHENHPCHEGQATEPGELAQDAAKLVHCGGGLCQICAVCHMPALDVASLFSPGSKPSRDWVDLTSVSGQSAPIQGVFKPPVSFV